MDAKKLLGHVKYMKKIVTGKSILPMLDCVMIKNGDLVCSNLETTITLKLGLESPDGMIEVKQLLKILPSLDGIITFSKESDKIVLTDGKRKYKFKLTNDIDDFPVTPNKGQLKHKFDEDDVFNMFQFPYAFIVQVVQQRKF